MRHNILELTIAIRYRYLKTTKKGKTSILSEFVASTGLHRKAAMRMPNKGGQKSEINKTVRPKGKQLIAQDEIEMIKTTTMMLNHFSRLLV